MSKVFFFILLTILASLVIRFFFSKDELRGIQESRLLILKQELINTDLRNSNKKIEIELDKLTNGGSKIEKYVRRQFFMIKEGELFYSLADFSH
jgi:cell division protein FtsB